MKAHDEAQRGRPPKPETAIRALLDVMGGQRNTAGELVDKIPPERFGEERARILRKLVLLAIAASANPDGSGAYPSREVIAHRCLVTVRAVDKVIAWHVKHALLRVESKAGQSGPRGRTNRYAILFEDGQVSTGWGRAEADEARWICTGAKCGCTAIRPRTRSRSRCRFPRS